MSLYRVILNALPILFPANIPLHENLRSLFASLFSNQDEQDDTALDGSPPSSSPSPPSQSLPLHISPGDRREARLSSSAQVHQTWVRKKTRRWHSVLAGAVAGAVAVSFEKRSRQKIIGQQLFVRCVSFASLSGSLNDLLLGSAGCRVHIMRTQRNVDFEFCMARFWSSRWRTNTHSSARPF